MPGPGPGLSWFEIDKLGFNEQFFSLLSLIASVLTLLGIIVLRPFMALIIQYQELLSYYQSQEVFFFYLALECIMVFINGLLL